MSSNPPTSTSRTRLAAWLAFVALFLGVALVERFREPRRREQDDKPGRLVAASAWKAAPAPGRLVAASAWTAPRPVLNGLVAASAWKAPRSHGALCAVGGP